MEPFVTANLRVEALPNAESSAILALRPSTLNCQSAMWDVAFSPSPTRAVTQSMITNTAILAPQFSAWAFTAKATSRTVGSATKDNEYIPDCDPPATFIAAAERDQYDKFEHSEDRLVLMQFQGRRQTTISFPNPSCLSKNPNPNRPCRTQQSTLAPLANRPINPSKSLSSMYRKRKGHHANTPAPARDSLHIRIH